jgi:hypothetical protein
MSFESIWATLCARRPRLHSPDAKVEFKAKNLKDLLRQVYERGQQDGDNGESLFNSLFGGKK